MQILATNKKYTKRLTLALTLMAKQDMQVYTLKKTQQDAQTAKKSDTQKNIAHKNTTPASAAQETASLSNAQNQQGNVSTVIKHMHPHTQPAKHSNSKATKTSEPR